MGWAHSLCPLKKKIPGNEAHNLQGSFSGFWRQVVQDQVQNQRSAMGTIEDPFSSLTLSPCALTCEKGIFFRAPFTCALTPFPRAAVCDPLPPKDPTSNLSPYMFTFNIRTQGDSNTQADVDTASEQNRAIRFDEEEFCFKRKKKLFKAEKSLSYLKLLGLRYLLFMWERYTRNPHLYAEST